LCRVRGVTIFTTPHTLRTTPPSDQLGATRSRLPAPLNLLPRTTYAVPRPRTLGSTSARSLTRLTTPALSFPALLWLRSAPPP